MITQKEDNLKNSLEFKTRYIRKCKQKNGLRIDRFADYLLSLLKTTCLGPSSVPSGINTSLKLMLRV